MKHFSQDYRLASCFKVFDEKNVRFFMIGGMVDVGIGKTAKDEYAAAVAKTNFLCDFTLDEYSKKVWSVCDYIINNLNNNVITTDFLLDINSSKISIEKLDFYTVKITLRIDHNNQSNTKSITLDNYDVWMIPKLVKFVCEVLKRRMIQ